MCLDVATIQRSALILRQIAGGDTGATVYTRLYKDLNTSASNKTGSAGMGAMDMGVVDMGVVKHITQRVVALAYTRFTTLLAEAEAEFVVKYGMPWTESAYSAVRTNENHMANTWCSAQKCEREYVKELCDDTVRDARSQSAKFDQDMHHSSHLTRKFTVFVRGLPAMNTDEFVGRCGEWMGGVHTAGMRTDIEYSLLRYVIVHTEAPENVDMEEVIQRMMCCMKSHKDARVRHVVAVGHCASYWSGFATSVMADLAVNKLSYENLHAVVCCLILNASPAVSMTHKKFSKALHACETSPAIDDRERELLRLAKDWLHCANFADYVLNGNFSIELFLYKLCQKMSRETGCPADACHVA